MFLCLLSVCVCDIDYRGTFSGLGPGFSLSMNYRQLHSFKFQRICIMASRTRLSGLKQSLVISSDRFTEKKSSSKHSAAENPFGNLVYMQTKLGADLQTKIFKKVIKQIKRTLKHVITRKLGSLRCTE